MECYVPFFDESSQSFMEQDEGQGIRNISRDEWIKSLPASWRTHAFPEKYAAAKSSIAYFTNLKIGFQKNCSRLQRYADNRERSTKLRFISDINDDEYDSLLSAHENEKATIPFMSGLDTLRSELHGLMQDCVKEKKLAITICGNIAEIEGKPKEIPLNVWHLLPEESKKIVLMTKEQNESECHQRGLLMLAELVRSLHDENVLLKRDIEKLCEKNLNLQIDMEKNSEELNKQKAQLSSANARLKSKVAEQTQSLTYKIIQLQKAMEDQEKEYLALREQSLSIGKKVNQLQQEKESLLTRLSQVAGTKLTMNNPAITDLSDKYRPMKLSEKFNGMYDDDWTDAVEELSSEGIEEKTVVVLLRDIVMKLSGLHMGVCCSTVKDLSEISVFVQNATAFRLCKESHMIWIQMPECNLLAQLDENEQEEAKKPYILDVELKEEEKIELQKCVNAFKRCHYKSFIGDCQKRFIPMALQMIQNAKQTSAESAPDVYQPPEFAQSNLESQIKETDFTRPMYKKIPGEIQSENPPSPKKQKTLLFNSLDIIQSTGKETVCDRKTQSARADFARPSQQTDAQPNRKQNTEQHVSNELKQPNEANSESDKFPKVRSFAKRIVKLCWWMQAMQPQVYLDCSVPKDGKFNHELYKAYMKSGSQIDYIVWPVMFLHENGPLLSKGVAQPM